MGGAQFYRMIHPQQWNELLRVNLYGLKIHLDYKFCEYDKQITFRSHEGLSV